jgi:hypothetical protein
LAEPLYQIRGRQIREEDLSFIRDIISRHWERGRTAISRVLCEHWDWRQPNGQFKGMACRALLLKLEEKKLVNLPPPLSTTNHRKPRTREANLYKVVNNVRFLILNWVSVEHLASKLLSANIRMLPGDWQAFYRHPVALLETFVDTTRFQGTCYRAANWVYAGLTKGRGRYDRYNRCMEPVKAVYLYPLGKRFREALHG